MRQKLLICKNNSDDTLTIVDEKKLRCELDTDLMEVFATYRGKKYQVYNSGLSCFIIIG